MNIKRLRRNAGHEAGQGHLRDDIGVVFFLVLTQISFKISVGKVGVPGFGQLFAVVGSRLKYTDIHFRFPFIQSLGRAFLGA